MTDPFLGAVVQNRYCPQDILADPHQVESRKFRIFIIAGVRLYREGMVASFAKCANFDVVGTASSMEEALPLIFGARPDVAIIDMATRQSLDIVRRMRDQHSSLLVVGFGVEEVVGEIVACAEAGFAGYVPGEVSLDGLVERVECVCRGGLVCSPHIAAGLFRSLAERPQSSEPGSVMPQLTRRERQVLKLIDDGLSNKMIAASLGIEVSTVKNHVHNLLEKLKVNSRMQAAAQLGAQLTTRRRSYQIEQPPIPSQIPKQIGG